VTLPPDDAADPGWVAPGAAAADLRSADDRDLPSRTDVMGAALSEVVGGPVGRHALIGRTRVLTPLRVMFGIALVFLASESCRKQSRTCIPGPRNDAAMVHTVTGTV
jgi:hypothetical protein